MTEIQDIIASMLCPCEYIGGPMDGRREETSFAAPYVCFPFEERDGYYVLVSERKDGRLVYEWRGE